MTRWARAEMIELGERFVEAFLGRTRTARFDLLKSKFPEHVEKRRRVILALHSMGLTRVESARVMNCERGQITYWIDPKVREQRIEARKARYRELRV
jgi:hypothetical protein